MQLCVCSDQLSDPADYWHVRPTVLSQLTAWWQRTVAHTEDPVLTDDLYMDIVARWVTQQLYMDIMARWVTQQYFKF